MRKTLPAVLCACALLLIGVASVYAEGMWYEDGRVHVDIDFTVHDFGTCSWPLASDASCWWLVSWNPSLLNGDLCDPPVECVDNGFQQTSFCHFKILDSDGVCLSFNSRPNCLSEAGIYDLIFSLPKEHVLDDGCISISPGSDFHSVEYSGYYQKPGFKLEEGESYTFQVTEQAEGCRTVVNSKDGEHVWHEQVLTIPACCVGVRGDADGSGELNIADANFLLGYLFRGGATPECFKEADINGDGQVDILDVNYLLAYLFGGGPAPADCP